MNVSVVVRSKDEADRLRLTLASLSRQTAPAEVVVVDDGSSDHTPAVISEASASLRLKTVRHEAAGGRSAAANAGARAASGTVLLFLDGDTLADPDLVRRHAAAHAAQPALIGRGETFHLRCTRFLRDPESATPMPGAGDRVARLSVAERDRQRVTRAQVLDDFAAIECRAEPGIYPGAGPRRLQEIELEALRDHPGCSVLWAAASGSNQSVGRDIFLDSGGFDEAIDINEHRELALRLCRAGLSMGLVAGARSYHLTHRSGWRDPLEDIGWEQVFHAAHPLPEVALLAVFWASLSPLSPLPEAERILSLPALEEAARSRTAAERDTARSRLGLPPLRSIASAAIGA
jgi:glycosyltransferase involved in cell wall biosynthesis